MGGEMKRVVAGRKEVRSFMTSSSSPPTPSSSSPSSSLRTRN